jgi:hypothetical protein
VTYFDLLPPVLKEALEALSPECVEAIVPHLIGDTSADWLSDMFGRAGQPVGATTIKLYRRRVKECASE